jgi:hypothetical protein
MNEKASKPLKKIKYIKKKKPLNIYLSLSLPKDYCWNTLQAAISL